MSSKKVHRKKKQESKKEQRSRWNPATLFLLFIVAAFLLMVVAGYFLRDPGPGDPPRPGAVWSPEHQHWH
jgi:hypothetical protein